MMRYTATTIGLALALGVAVPAAATSYQLRIAPGQGPMLTGPTGMHALDIRTDDTLIRVIAPGTRIDKRGTVRVLVMNLAKPAYEFGPEEVAIELPDGSALHEVPVAVFDSGEQLVGREVARSMAVDRATRDRLSSLADSATTGVTAQSIGGHQAGSADARSDSLRRDEARDANIVPGARLLDNLNGVLRPYTIGPKQAWGGYLVFDMPKALRHSSGAQPVTIVVRTGDEVHRIKATLRPL